MTPAQNFTIASGLSRVPGRRWRAWHRYGPVALIAFGLGMYAGCAVTVAVMQAGGWL